MHASAVPPDKGGGTIVMMNDDDKTAVTLPPINDPSIPKISTNSPSHPISPPPTTSVLQDTHDTVSSIQNGSLLTENQTEAKNNAHVQLDCDEEESKHKHPRTFDVECNTSIFQAFTNISTCTDQSNNSTNITHCAVHIHVTNRRFPPLRLKSINRGHNAADCEFALTQAVLNRIAQYNLANKQTPIHVPSTSKVLTIFKGLNIKQIKPTDFKHTSNIDPLLSSVTLLLPFEKPDQCAAASDTLNRIGIKHSTYAPETTTTARRPWFVYGFVTIPHHVDNSVVDTYLQQHAHRLPSLHIARPVQPEPCNQMHQNRALWRCLRSEIQCIPSLPALPGMSSLHTPDWSFLHNNLHVCTHCWKPNHSKQRCPQSNTSNAAAAQYHNRKHACIRCGSFEHHADTCAREETTPGCPLCCNSDNTNRQTHNFLFQDAGDDEKKTEFNPISAHLMTKCPLYKTQIIKITEHVIEQMNVKRQQVQYTTTNNA